MSENRYKDHIRTEDGRTATEPITEENRYKDHIRTEDAERPVETSQMTGEQHRYKDHIRTEDADRPVEEMAETHTYKDYIRTEPITFERRRESFIDDMQKQLNEWNKRLKRFEADMALSGAEIESNWQSTAQNLKDRRDALEKRLDALVDASEEAWDDLEEGVTEAWEELSAAMSDAEQRFRKS